MTVSIILPTYEERANLPEVLRRIDGAVPWGKRRRREIIVVDDASPDGTGRLARRLARRYRGLRVLSRPARTGIADAVRAGLRSACGEVLAVMDADLQHPPERIGAALALIDGGADLVVLSRHVRGSRLARWSPWRRLVSRCSILLARMLVPASRRVRDPLSGFFVLKREIRGAAMGATVGSKILLSILAHVDGIRVAELPYTFSGRARGKSKMGLREALADARLLVALAFAGRNAGDLGARP